MGKLRTADLLGCLEVPSQGNSPSPRVQVSIIDGAAIVNMLRPGAAKKFSDYAKQVFTPYIMSQLQHVDVVWDEYFPESLKAETRGREFVDVLSHIMPFLETGRSFSVSMTTRLRCSPSWQLVLQLLTLASKLSAPIMLKSSVLNPEINQVLHHVHTRSLTPASYCT